MNMEAPLISLIIPVFNREPLLPYTLDSLSAQTHRPLEVVLVDNGSTDGSMAMCEQFRLQQDSSFFSVKVLSQPNGGANGARNAGFEASSGEYVLFFDSDDTLYPDSLARIAAQLINADAPDMLVFPFQLVFPDGRTSLRPHRFSADPAAQLIDTVAATHNMCLKRSLVKAAGLWDESLSRWQDLEFGFRLLLNADTVAWINGKPFHEVKVHASSISGHSFAADVKRVDQALDRIQTSILTVEDASLRHHLQRALCYKRTVLAGNLWQEGQRVMSRQHVQKALHELHGFNDRLYTLVLRISYLYMKLNGRGFWRIADCLS